MSHPLLAETKTLLSDLVSFNTEPSLTNLPLVERVQAYLNGHQLPNSVQLNEDGDKASLLSTIGPAIDGGIVLSGHTDVVDALGQQWQSPPFELTERDGKLYGRGSCDMKGFIACILAQAPVFAAANIKKPVHIALSRDEETGSLGMPDMLALIRQSGLTPAIAIVGEPTKMGIVAGHKAGYEMRTVFTGTPAHSALPDEGSNAIVAAAQFAVYLAALSEEMATQPRKGSPFVPPHGIINVGVIRGGTARNIIAGRCEVEWHYRPLPNDDAEKIVGQAHDYAQQVLLPMMRAKGHAADVETLTEAFYPGLAPQADSPALQLVQALLGEDDYTVAPFGADSGHFQQSGIPAVLIGPGNIAQAHKPDEFIDEEELNRCLYFLDNLCAYLSG